MSQLWNKNNWKASWNAFNDAQNWSNSWNAGVIALPKGVATFAREEMGEEYYNALTDGKFTYDDVQAVATLIVNIEIARGGDE